MDNDMVNNINKKVSELYQEYLNDKLALVFCDAIKVRYDIKSDFHDGYAIVKRSIYENYVDKDGNLISEEWYFEASDFCEGYARIRRYGISGYNFIDTAGNLISEEQYAEASDFCEGYARIRRDDGISGYNFIDTAGNLISEKWYDDALDFHDGYAMVHRKYKGWNVIDRRGNLIREEWNRYDSVYKFCEGYAIVKRSGKYNFINSLGEELDRNIWYDEVSDFNEGYARVWKDGKGWNFINKNGVLISNKWYISIRNFHDGYAQVEGYIYGSFNYPYCAYNFIDKEGNLTSEIWYDRVFNFYDDRARVFDSTRGKHNYINRRGELIGGIWYDYAEDFNEGYAKVRNAIYQYNFIDKEGNLTSEIWYDKVSGFNEGYAKVYNKVRGFNYIGVDRKLLCEWGRKEPIVDKYFLYRANVLMHWKTIESDIKDYDVSKNIFGYVCKNSSTNIRLKYQPIKFFGTRYILCYSKKTGFMLYDRESKEYESIFVKSYDDNLIIGDDKKYLIYDNKKIDITEYYDEHLKGMITIKVHKGINILTENEFSVYNSYDIIKLLEEEKIRNEKEKKRLEEEQERERKRLEEIRKQERIDNNLKNTILEYERINAERDRKREKAYAMLKEGLKILQEGNNNVDGTIPRMNVDDLFITVGDHKEINPNLIKFLRYIDLRGILFKNVKMTGIDFSGSNISLYPEDVYQKDLSGCNFEGVFIDSFTNFNGVDIRGAKFRDGVNKNELGGIQNVTFKNAIYDDTTTYNGIPFTELYGPCEKLSSKKRS